MGHKDEIIRNYKGEIISGIAELSSPDYGTGKTRKTEKGEVPEVNWKKLKFADRHGFDIRNREKNGNYIIEVKLPFGTKLLRYGGEGGHYTAPLGTPYEQLSLPYKKETVEYHEYVVIANEITVICKVDKGIVAPGFDSDGGAIQYLHHETIGEELKNEVLDKIDLWGDKINDK